MVVEARGVVGIDISRQEVLGMRWGRVLARGDRGGGFSERKWRRGEVEKKNKILYLGGGESLEMAVLEQCGAPGANETVARSVGCRLHILRVRRTPKKKVKF